MLLDALTVLFVVAGGLLLWINIRPRAGDVMIAKRDDDHPNLDR
jgi:hypothetical protein